jgi:hypothetical protein
MADWIPPEAAASAPAGSSANAAWVPPEAVKDQTAASTEPDDSESTFVHDPSDTAEQGGGDTAEAQRAGAEATLGLATGMAGATAAGVVAGGKLAWHGLQALVGYGAANTPGAPITPPQQVTDHLDKAAQGDWKTYDDIANFLTYVPRSDAGQQALQTAGQLPGKAVDKVVTPLLAAGGVSPDAIQTLEEAGGQIVKVAPALGGARGLVAAYEAIPDAVRGITSASKAAARTIREGAWHDPALDTTPTPSAQRAAPAPPAKPLPFGAVTAEQLRAAPNPIPPPNSGAPADEATQAVQKPHLQPKAGESAQAAAQRQGVAPAAQEAAPAAPAASAPVAILAGQRGIGGRQGGAARLFAPPQAEGPQFAAKADEDTQAARQQTLGELNALGGGVMKNDRQGAVSGDWDQTGNEHETAKMPGASGKLMHDQIASEHQALHNATQNVADSVGSDARNDVDRDTLEQRGAVVRDAVQAIDQHFTGAANGFYATARANLGDNPMPSMPRVQAILSDASHDVNPTAGSLRRAAQTKLQQLWTVGDTRGNIHTAPGTIGAAERFHEFLNDAYHNESASLIRKLKNATDLDIAQHAGGPNLFEAGRSMIAHREQMLEPDGVNELRAPKDRNKIDHEVPLHEVMDHVVNQDREHFDHFMNVMRAGAHLSPEVAQKTAAAIREIQGHMVARLHNAARGEGGAWKATDFYKAANRFSTNMPSAFAHNPQALANLQTINRAGNILKMDKSYPGAIAQAAKVGVLPNLLHKAAKGGKLLATGGGAHFGGPIGAVAGHMGGHFVESAAERLVEGRRAATVKRSLLPRQQGAVQILDGGREVHVSSDNGDTTLRRRGGAYQVIDTRTDDAAQGKGEGAARLKEAFHHVAEPQGQPLLSDTLVSKSAGKVYDRLEREGYKIWRNPNVSETRNGMGEEALESTNGSPVYAIQRGPQKAPIAIQGHTAQLRPDLEAQANRMLQQPGMQAKLGELMKNQRGSASILNVGHHVGNPEAGGRVLEPEEIARAVSKVGGSIASHDVIRPGEGGSPNLFEPTSVIGLKKPLSDAKGVALARELGRKAIPQRTGPGEGQMFVPPEHTAEAKSEGWDKYNPDYFHMADARNESTHLANLAAATQHMTPAEQAQVAGYRESAVQKVVDAFHGSTPTDETAAMALVGKAKKGWYARSAKALTQMFGPDATRFGALLAAMSPQIGIEGNFSNALKTWVNWDKAGRPTGHDAIRQVMENSVQRSPDAPPGKSSVLPAWHQNSVRALTSKDPEAENFKLSGPKVDSFMRNLRDNVHEVTNDSWNAVAMNMDQALFGGRRALAPENTFGERAGKSPSYIGVSAKIRAAAGRLSKLTGETWTPREVQETMWSFVKTAFEHSERTGKSIPDLIRSGELNDDLIGATPDFHRLFSSGEHRGFLRGTRYEANAERLAGEPGEAPAPAAASGKALAAARKSLAPHLEKVSKRLQGQLEERGVRPTVTDANEVPF